MSQPNQESTRATPTTEAKHTPGPWRAHTKAEMPRGDADLIKPIGGYSYISAEPWLAFARVCVKVEGDRGNSPEGLANARLIASAPDMLAALERLCKNATECEMHGEPSQVDGIDWDDIVTARVAISKATGGVA